MTERNVKVLSLCLLIKHFTGEHILVGEQIYYSLPQVVLKAKVVSELRFAHCKLEPCNQIKFFHLKSLNLDDVSLDEQVIQNLTLNCPLIEDFQLYNCHGFKHLEISNLPQLNLFYVEFRIMVSGIEIEAPSLQTFSYWNNNTNQFQNFEKIICP